MCVKIVWMVKVLVFSVIFLKAYRISYKECYTLRPNSFGPMLIVKSTHLRGSHQLLRRCIMIYSEQQFNKLKI